MVILTYVRFAQLGGGGDGGGGSDGVAHLCKSRPICVSRPRHLYILPALE